MHLEARNSHNQHVRLEPLAERHRAELQAACAADLQVWRDLYPHSMAPEHFDAGWDRMMAQAADGSWIPFAVRVGEVCVGMTSYIGPDPVNASVEIGGTYYHPDHRGGPVNPATKRLMLEHAFASGARRVQLNVDAINHRSRAAVLKLGAVQEGVLRQHRVVWTGRIRDTVVFSILAAEWPAVRAGLDARLAGY